MFTLDWHDPQTFWLNVTNWVLLLVTAGCFVILAVGILREVLKRVQKQIPIGVREPFDPHTAAYPDLGYTMADGGEKAEGRIDPKPRRK